VATFGTVEVPIGEVPIQDISDELLERAFLKFLPVVCIATGWTPEVFWRLSFDEYNSMIAWLLETGVLAFPDAGPVVDSGSAVVGAVV
jgi:hypothetical protein